MGTGKGGEIGGDGFKIGIEGVVTFCLRLTKYIVNETIKSTITKATYLLFIYCFTFVQDKFLQRAINGHLELLMLWLN